MMNTSDTFDDSDIAIIGMAGRFPGARNIDDYWRNLRDGLESIVTLTDEELAASGIGREVAGEPNYVKAAGVLADIDLFDASFFGFTVREAEITDPQQRLFLECAWEALESAGCDSETYAGKIGVYAGTRMSTYLLKLYEDRHLIKTMGSYRILMGNDKDYLPTWTSYKMNLKGPSVAVQTACSTSLVAVHMACQSLLNGECDAALAGGASVFVPQKAGYFYQEGGITSPDGHCRAFDARAQGTVRGSGVGIVVLKRLADALSNGDYIHAVIKGSAINNDGSLKIGFTAPSVEGQAAVIAEAQALARTPPETITYIETHGTGTALGDPIEVEALTKVFRATTEKKGFCAIGSVKTNIGHLDTAAGVAGLIKTILALKHRQIPPSLHFEHPNPRINFESGPFHVNSKLSDWRAGTGHKLRAGVSSFGIGGTNAHLVLEEAPPSESSGESAPNQLLLLSAKTDSALEHATANLAAHLSQRAEHNLADIAHTLQTGRRSFEHRRMLVCRSASDALDALGSDDRKRILTSFEKAKYRPVVFMFPGQGTQYVNMAGGLYRSEPAFRKQVDLCSGLLEPHLGFDLRSLLYPAPEKAEEAAHKLNQTFVTQPALFVIEYALAMLWIERGVSPDAMIGHSIGEYVAACVAGVFSLKDALALVAARGHLIQQMPAGAMLAVRLSETELLAYLSDGLSLAAVNGLSNYVVSGQSAAVEELETRLASQGIACRRLQTSHAFHSEMMEPILAEFAGYVKRVELREPRIPYLSNLTGSWITSEQVREASYWTAHLRQTVRFAGGVAELLKEQERILLEVGPGQTLSMLVRQQAREAVEQVVLSSLAGASAQVSDEELLLATTGKLWLAGKKIEWSRLHSGKRHRVPLPTYPFERQRYWIETMKRGEREPSRTAQSGQLSGQAAAPQGNGYQHDNSVKDGEILMSQAYMAVSPAPVRRDTVMSTLKGAVNELTGLDPATIDTGATFYELGADSLLLIQVAHTIQEKFGLKISFRMLFDELSTLDRLADYLDRELPPDAIPVQASFKETLPVAPPPVEPQPRAASTHASLFEQSNMMPEKVANGNGAVGEGVAGILSQQLLIMARQLEVLHHNQRTVEAPALPQSVLQPAGAIESSTKSVTCIAAPPAPSAALSPGVNAGDKSAPEPFTPYRAREVRASERLTQRQQKYLKDFMARYTERTKKSKQLTQAFRYRHAEPRASLGFRLLWKEIIYPIIAERSAGSKIWDVDGNEYVDVAMGFGVNLFGHAPPFINEALEAQLKRGFHIGPQSDLAGEVATLLCELTGMERAAFCNSGTEAVMTALRVARTVTRRHKIALFAGSYHGTFDGTLAKAGTAGGQRVTLPLSPGTPSSMVEDVLVLSYNNPESLRILKAHGHELAAVLVEPVQSRRPDVQPGEFLQELRRLTEESGTALIFDEVVTGFRAHPGGAQALFNVRADLATYGKVLGGGMPIGAVTGRAEYMDAIDGGMWRYGDDSYPQAEQMFFAGTFCKHPLAMAAARAVLSHLKSSGPALQQQLNGRTSKLAGELNSYFAQEQVAIHVGHFGSLLYFIPAQRIDTLDLFFYHLIERGVYIWEGHTCFLSTAHTDADIDYVFRAVKQSIEGMREGGFLPEPVPHPPEANEPLKPRTGQSPNGRHDSASAHATASPQAARLEVAAQGLTVSDGPARNNADTLPLTEVQKQLWFLSQLGDGVSGAYHESVTLQLRGPFNLKVMETAINILIARHEVLRTTFSPEGDYQRVNSSLRMELPLVDFSKLDADKLEAEAERWVAAEVQQPFDLAQGPLIRVRALRLDEQYHYLVITTHHLITDGRSYGVLLRELSALYAAECQGIPCQLPRAMQFSEYAQLQAQWQQGADTASDEDYWQRQFADGFPILELPADHPQAQRRSNKGARYRTTIGETLTGELKKMSARQGCTLFTTLLGGFSLLLHQLSGQDDIVVGINVAQQLSTGARDFVGFRINPLSIRSRAPRELKAADYMAAVKATVLDAYEHQNVAVNKLNKSLKARRESGRLLLVSAAFNLDHSGGELQLFNLETKAVSNHNGHSTLDIYLNVVEKRDRLLLDCDYNCDLYEADTIRRWMEHLEALLIALSADPSLAVSALPRPASPAALPMTQTQPDASQDIYKGSNLTRYQMLIWAGQMLHPNIAMYINAGYSIIPIAIDREHYQRAVTALIDRSDALRTVFEDVGGVPQQRVLAVFPGEVEYLDFSHSPDPHTALHEWAQARCRIPLDLRKCLFDVALIKLSDEEFAEYLNTHHIVTDAQSVAYIIRLISEYYSRSLRGDLEDAPALPQFKDYVVSEREFLNSPRASRAAAYWREKLTEEIEPLNFYGTPPVKRTTRVERVSCELGDERTRRIKAYAARKDISAMSVDVALHNVFAALIFAYLQRISGSTRISLGDPFHNRRAKQETIGLLMQILPLRVSVEESDTFKSLISKVVTEHFRALQYSVYPVGNPIQRQAYDVEYNYITATNPAFFEGVPVKDRWLHPGHANESLAIQIHQDTGENFICEFDFHRDVFDDAQRAQAARHFLKVVDAFLDDDARPVRSVSLLSDEERSQLLSEFNQTAMEFPADRPFIQLFEEQADRTPDRIAVSCEGRQLSYAELNAGAERLAGHLREKGVGPEVLVALMARRGIDYLTAILAVFKAGGAYLPLDPQHPSERLGQVLSQSKCSLVLAAGDFDAALTQALQRMAPEKRPLVLHLDELSQKESAGIELHPQCASTNLAYVIYTSGSTGVPKGAMIEQKGMLNHLFVKIRDLQLTAEDVVAQTASQCFDISVWQFLAALLVGGQVHIAGDEVMHSPQRLQQEIKAGKISIIETVPSMLRAMLEETEAAETESPRPDALRWMLVTGEPLPPELCRRWLAHYPSVPMLNAYGPTECSDDVTHHVIDTSPSALVANIPIGRTVGNIRIYVTDRRLEPVPIGMTGEICVGGVGVGRGYLHDPVRTAEVFVADPFAVEPGARLYKTGDLGRYLPDGCIEYLGRLDQQVKIRGFRIELGEIEAVLSRVPGVRSCVVEARSDGLGDKRLAAYIVADTERPPSISQLRTLLKEKLPEYMVPAAFVMLDALPLTPNGKVNRRALPVPDRARPELEVSYVEARTPVERLLAEIWAQVLNRAVVGVHDNFFELGGDSILTIQIAAKSNRAGVRIMPMQIFEHQTVYELAAAVGSATAVEAEQGLVTGAVPLTPIQHWFFEQGVTDPHHWNQAVMFELRQTVEPLLLERSLRQLLEHHDALRMRFTRGAAGWQQHNVGIDGAVPFSHFQFAHLPQAERRPAIEAAAAEQQSSLNLSQGPLIRMALFDLGAESPARLMIVVHHLVMDGVSWRILLDDLQTIYEQLSRGQAVELASKTTSFKQWSERLSEHAQFAESLGELDYWLKGGSTQDLCLPVDFVDGVNTKSSARVVATALDPEETRALLQEMPQAHQVYIQEALLAALARTFSDWTNSNSLLIEVEGHGREELFEGVDVSRTVGWFTSLFPTVLQMERDAAPLDALMSIRNQWRDTPRRGIGYGLLRYLNRAPEAAARLRAVPRAEVSFNYLGQFDQVISESSIFAPALESCGPTGSRQGRRERLLDINGLVVKGQLRLEWTYSENLYRRSTIESLAEACLRELRSLISQCLAPETEVYTPAGFADFDWSKEEVDEITSALSRSRGEV